jgi:endonuclease III
MESAKKMKERAGLIYETLDPIYTHEKTALTYKSPFQLLVSTILSAQCTDKQVNMVTKDLFKKYKSPRDYVSAPIEELEADIRPTGFYKNKAKSLKGCSQGLLDLYGGEVPASMEALIKLPGVGRKTANCVLGAAFDIPGVVVDTHVKRLSLRLGLTQNENPDKIETDLQEILPKERWRRFSDLLIYHGRAVCKARKPDHGRCVISAYCPSRSI